MAACEQEKEQAEPPESPITARTMKESRWVLPFPATGRTGSRIHGIIVALQPGPLHTAAAQDGVLIKSGIAN